MLKRARHQTKCLQPTIDMAENLIQIQRDAAPVDGTLARKLKTMLLFPPEWVPTAPYLALPCLTAVLREAGHQVVQKDVNIEMYDLFFSDAFLIWVKARMEMQLRQLSEKDRTGWLSDQEAEQRACLMAKAQVDVFELAEQAQAAKAIVRGAAFYDADKLEWALNVFREVMQYISVTYYPASLVFYPMESNLLAKSSRV
jgi:anaerobic magnesium-protoporphyrin IX monomethyl ester cyclase